MHDDVRRRRRRGRRGRGPSGFFPRVLVHVQHRYGRPLAATTAVAVAAAVAIVSRVSIRVRRRKTIRVRRANGVVLSGRVFVVVFFVVDLYRRRRVHDCLPPFADHRRRVHPFGRRSLYGASVGDAFDRIRAVGGAGGGGAGGGIEFTENRDFSINRKLFS